MGVVLGNLVIANGAAPSTSLGGRLLRTIRSLTIHGPSALTNTVTLQSLDAVGGSAWTPVQSGGSDVTITAAKALVITEVPFGTIRVNSGGNEGAERVFPVWGEEGTHQ